jgi:hypothetical protein
MIDLSGLAGMSAESIMEGLESAIAVLKTARLDQIDTSDDPLISAGSTDLEKNALLIANPTASKPRPGTTGKAFEIRCLKSHTCPFVWQAVVTFLQSLYREYFRS